MRRSPGLIIVSLVLAACGGSGEADPASASTTVATASTTTAAPTTTVAPATTTTTTQAPATTSTAASGDSQSTPEGKMTLTSTAFDHEGLIPQIYSCDGSDISPPLAVDGVPEAAVSLALVMDDPDAPVGVWDHWVAYDIAVDAAIPEDVGALGISGQNSWGQAGYGGPCPPGGTHRYVFTVYAVDAQLGLESGATKSEVLAAMSDHLLAEATLLGSYTR